MLKVAILLHVIWLEHVFNPALPYEILLFLSLITLIIFIIYFYRQLKSKRRHFLLKQLADAKLRSNLIFDFAPNEFWVIQDKQITWQGQTLSVDRFCEDIKEASQRVQFQKMLASPATTIGNSFRIQIPSSDNPSAYQWVETSCLSQDNDCIQGYMVNCDKQKEEEDLLIQTHQTKENVQLKETILANLNQEINSPLSAIIGYSELLSHNELDIAEKELREYAQIIKSNAASLSKILDDAVSTKIGTWGTFTFRPTLVDVEQLFSETYESTRILIPSNLVFKLQKGEPDIQINIDKDRIRQVLNNFLSNAIKFTDAGSITLGWVLHQERQEIEFYVEDTGKGISQVDQVRIFDRYFTTDVEHNGLGLGLNICKAIIEQQGGRIQVKSQLGKGSRFSAYLKIEKGGNA